MTTRGIDLITSWDLQSHYKKSWTTMEMAILPDLSQDFFTSPTLNESGKECQHNDFLTGWDWCSVEHLCQRPPNSGQTDKLGQRPVFNRTGMHDHARNTYLSVPTGIVKLHRLGVSWESILYMGIHSNFYKWFFSCKNGYILLNPTTYLNHWRRWV